MVPDLVHVALDTDRPGGQTLRLRCCQMSLNGVRR
jgi:hypothetical protein